MSGTGNPKDTKRPVVVEHLKLYKKPKPGQPIPEPSDIKEPLNFLEQIEQEALHAQHTPPHHTVPPETGGKKGRYIVLTVLLVLLGIAIFYFYYKPPPPEVQGPRDHTTLLPACQKGNGVACGELALLEYLGQKTLAGLPKEMPANANNAFIYARLSCSHDSTFGCYLMWRLWTKKETNLLNTESAEEALKKGCAHGGKLSCILRERFAGKRDIAFDDLHKAFSDAADGKKPPRFSENDSEQRLYTIFLATEQ